MSKPIYVCLQRRDNGRFGFTSKEEAATYLDTLLERIAVGFDSTVHWLDQEWRKTMHERLSPTSQF